jgi:hypothetical protein
MKSGKVSRSDAVFTGDNSMICGYLSSILLVIINIIISNMRKI